MKKIAIAIHAGAGNISPFSLTEVQLRDSLNGLKQALAEGYEIISRGGNSLDAVTVAVMELENNILFNAGRGSVFTNAGVNEMDAAIMKGQTLEAGAVTGLRNIKNPVLLAREIMENSPHVFLSGPGANDFAASKNYSLTPDEYFFSEKMYRQWQRIKDTDSYQSEHIELKKGTVGAVAIDKEGHLASATSSGGMTNKRYGRVSDCPVIGAGTYANHICAISCTGHGELFIRSVAAHDVASLMEYKGYSLREAMDIVVNKKLKELSGDGGMIGVDQNGNAEVVFNTTAMYRGIRNSDGRNDVAIFN